MHSSIPIFDTKFMSNPKGLSKKGRYALLAFIEGVPEVHLITVTTDIEINIIQLKYDIWIPPKYVTSKKV